MKNSLAACLFLLALTTQSLAQANREQGFRVNGVVVFLTAVATGQTTAEGFHRLLSIEDKAMEISLINPATGLFIGYTLEIERLSEPAKLKISVRPLPEETVRHLRESVLVKRLAANHPKLDNYDPLALPRYPAPQIINLSDQLKLDLWVNTATGAVMSDRLRFTLDEPEQPRAFTLADVLFKFNGFRLFINGEVSSGERPFSGFSGPLPWFAVPGNGRFLISLQPHTGYDFQSIGVVEGNKLSFRLGENNYEWVSNTAILPTRGRWQVWVLHDRNFQSSAAALSDANLVSKGNCCLYGALSSPAQLAK